MAKVILYMANKSLMLAYSRLSCMIPNREGERISNINGFCIKNYDVSHSFLLNAIRLSSYIFWATRRRTMIFMVPKIKPTTNTNFAAASQTTSKNVFGCKLCILWRPNVSLLKTLLYNIQIKILRVIFHASVWSLLQMHMSTWIQKTYKIISAFLPTVACLYE